MSQTQTVHTQYGEVSIETVECDSCGNTIAKEDAHRFAMGEGTVHGFEDAERHGYACEHCVENGPVTFLPDEWEFQAQENWMFGIFAWPFLLMFSLPDIGTHKGASEYVVATIGTLLWIGLPLLAYLFVF